MSSTRTFVRDHFGEDRLGVMCLTGSRRAEGGEQERLCWSTTFRDGPNIVTRTHSKPQGAGPVKLASPKGSRQPWLASNGNGKTPRMRCSMQPISLRAGPYGTPSASNCFRRITPVLMLPTTRRPSTPGPFSLSTGAKGRPSLSGSPSKQQSETFAQWFQGRRLRGDSGLWNGMPLA